VKTVQYGVGERGARSAVTGRQVCGDKTFDEQSLERARVDFGEQIRSHPQIDDYYRERIPDFGRITAPLFSAGNWGGQGLHLRGNVEGYIQAGSAQKWLEMHGIEHWTHFYTDYGRELQRKFFDFFLKGEDTGWSKVPPVLLNIRQVDGSFSPRAESEWPIARTRWTKLFLDATARSLGGAPPDDFGEVTFEALGDGVTFSAAPFEEETEITGPSAVKLWVSSSTDDADLFVIVRLFAPGGEEVVFQGAIDPHAPLGQGWLRVSQRALDERRSTPERPVHTHTESSPLTPNELYEVDVEVLPTCVVAPVGYRLALTVQGRDYECPSATGDDRLSNFKNVLRGCGPFLHDDPRDRPSSRFGGRTSIYTGGGHDAFVLLPFVPGR
jgi:predicted acyl esterase